MSEAFNIAELLSNAARAHPHRRAVVFPHTRDRFGRVAYTHLTFAQLERESSRLARALGAYGLAPGMRTIVMVRPSLDFFVLTFALFKAAAVPVVVDPGMGLWRMLHCLQSSRPQAFIGIPPAHALRKCFPKFFRSVSVWVTVGKRWFWGGTTLAHLSRSPFAPLTPTTTGADDTAAILFTTGSTGPAKGVVYTHANFRAQIHQIREAFGIRPGEIDLPTFPLFALFDPALGMTAVIPDMDPTRPAHVDPRKIIEAVTNHGVTNMFASPALLDRVGRYGRAHGIKLPSLKRVVSAGAPVYPENIARFAGMLAAGSEIHTPYGATEAVPLTSIASAEILGKTRELSEQGYGMCVGRPLAGTRLRIITISDGAIENWRPELEVPDGEIGEIAVCGDLVTRRYFENPAADRLAKIADGDRFWHRMGDLGWIDKRGRLWFCGRKSQRVVMQRQMLYTVPCEAIFNRHPAVRRSALVGIGRPPHQQPVMCVELRRRVKRAAKAKIQRELLALAKQSPLTAAISTILLHTDFPVDIRHNSKIFREKLAVWAQKRLGPDAETRR